MSEFRPDSSVVAEVRPSPNHGERAGGGPPTMIVLHYTGMPDNEAAIRQLVTDAGFTRFRRATETPFNLVYEARR